MRTNLLAPERTGLTIAARGATTVVAVDPAESPAVRRAAEDLARDLGKVCGAVVEEGPSSAAHVVLGTIGTSPAIDAAIGAGVLDIAPLRQDGTLRWEGYVLQVVGETLYVAGTDRRGTIYGIYELCEQAGVSPWWWWGDVPVKAREHVTLRPDAVVHDWPSVRYRGVFLNDEEELDAWAAAHTADGTIGPETYRRVFELLLRLKANYLWPAMHVNAFNHDPENGRLADEMGIVVGSSHCDMLLRSNEHEFRPWCAAQGEQVEYDYSVPGHNQDMLREYWRGSVRQNGAYEVSWTVGMRAIHDSGFTTRTIDADESLSPEQKHRAKVDMLGEVIADQRRLLTEGLGDRAATALQLFIPYKEVLPLYDSGLDLPDDVTVVWANDNFGHVRRLPSEAERARSGGHGLYYHSSYWSPPPRSYLATSSTPLALMRHELEKSWRHGIRTLWVDNVGGLKPLELETEYFLRYAWDVERAPDAPPHDFVRAWADRTFSGGHGERIASMLSTYYRVNQQRKIEHLAADVFPQTGYGDEAGRRLAVLRDLVDESLDLLAALPDAERDAFAQLVAVKVHLAYLVNGEFVHADRSTLAHEQGKLAAADHHLAVSRAFADAAGALIDFYNGTMSDGRWEHIFTPKDFPPPTMALFPPGRPALQIPAESELGVVVRGDDAPVASPELVLGPDGPSSSWLELFPTGARPVRYAITADDWITVSEPVGEVATEARLGVTLAGTAGPTGTAAGRRGSIRIRDLGTGAETTVAVRVAAAAPTGVPGYVEADGVVAIDAARPDRPAAGADASWRVVPDLGRDTTGLLESTGAARSESEAVEYDVHLLTPGAHVLELHRLPTLTSTGRIRVGVSVDEHATVTVESPTTDEHRGVWDQAVLDGVERLRLRLPYLVAGPHTVRLHALDPDVGLSKLVLYTAAERPTNLGPPVSRHDGRPWTGTTDPDPAQDPRPFLDRLARAVYRTDPATVPLPDVRYADSTFWATETTFKRPTERPQANLGPATHTARPDGTKDLLAALDTGIHREVGGTIAIEAEAALVEGPTAWTTPSLAGPPARWRHTQAETDGRTGLAMHVPQRGLVWDDPATAPGLHYRLDVTSPGTWHVWLLVKFDDKTDDSCVLALDGTPQPVTEQFCGGDLYTFGTQQVWMWVHLADLAITAGPHTLSVLAGESGLRVDRIHLTTHDDLPPADAAWPRGQQRP
ncbi:glycosyl hydrolase 115 family protein [Actinotalea sp. M2MS4P-6]|uniref:glycosyl hydrolase 115 family protein n=1 Tax=Actinotalea sp. M2MS4P-6 TaxID=2983762 RepID=UPI0021E451F0|nr:glycosyl hydrolase 115 family protein [Actinotalea sp. M2MS4P-6]MCV2394439.1 glycosyl hydrolase 115 family protein [Actinotalea sp. M2MS4P-6]